MLDKIRKTVSNNPLSTAGALVNPAVALGTGGYMFDQYLNYKNYKLQKEQYEYEKGLQQQIFSREDNATQRRVADLRAAGLSPVLAAGSAAGSGAVISTEAPQIGKTNLSENALAIANMIKMKADISRTEAEEALTRMQQQRIKTLLPVEYKNIMAQTKQANSGAYNLTQQGRTNEVTADTVETSRVPNNGIVGQLYNSITGMVNRMRSGLGLQPRHIQQQNLNNQRTIPPRGGTGQTLMELRRQSGIQRK